MLSERIARCEPSWLALRSTPGMVALVKSGVQLIERSSMHPSLPICVDGFVHFLRPWHHFETKVSHKSLSHRKFLGHQAFWLQVMARVSFPNILCVLLMTCESARNQVGLLVKAQIADIQPCPHADQFEPSRRTALFVRVWSRIGCVQFKI